MPDPQQQINEQNVYIRDTLMSIAAKYAETLKDAVQEAFDNVDATVLQNVGKDLTRSFTKLAKMSDDFANNQNKIKKGLLEQKDIEKQIQSVQEKRALLERKIEHARRLGLEISEADHAAALESLRVQEEMLENDKKLAKSMSGKIGVQKAWNDIQKKFNVDQLKETFTLAGMLKLIVDAGLNFNKASVNIGKNLGYGASQADRVTNNIVNAARGSENLNFTLVNAAEAMNDLVSSTGLVAEYSADTLETQIMLTKQFGLTGEEAAGIYKFSVLTGQAASKVNDKMVGAFVAARNQFKVGANFKQVMAEAAKVSGQLAANLGYNPERITKAVVAMKAFGTTLEQTKAQGEALLNFESSLEAELKAELLTGKAINLEKARAAALAGDQVTLAEELTNQGMTLDKFQGMNVLAQKSFAEALGLSADQLSDQLQKQKLAIESGKSLAQLTKEEALEAQKRQNIQDKFNQAVLKLQDVLGSVVAGPIGMLFSILSDVLGVVGKITAGIQDIFGSGIAKTLIGALAGFAVGGPVGALIGGLGGAISGMIADDMVGYGARTLVTPDGPVALNNNDTVIAGTNLFKGDDVLSFGKGALRLGGGNDELIAKLDQIASRPAVAYIQGERPFADNLGRQSQLFTSGMQNQSKLA